MDDSFDALDNPSSAGKLFQRAMLKARVRELEGEEIIKILAEKAELRRMQRRKRYLNAKS